LIVLVLLYAVTVLLVPGGAVWAWRRGGARGLMFLTVVVVALFVVLALVVASEQGGNRIVSTRGYGYTATRTLLFAGLASIMPSIASAMSVWAAAPRVRPRSLYPIAVATALVGTCVGTILAIYALW
jgi:hypothetical protein